MTRRRGWREGTISQRKNGSWRAQICLGGERYNFSSKTKAECINWLRRISTNGSPEQEVKEINSLSGKLQDYLDEWFKSVKHTLRPKTETQYRQIMLQYIIPNLGNIRLCDLQINRIDRFYSDLLNQGVGVRTIRITHSVLHVALERAVRYELIVRNPAHGAAVPKKPMTEMNVLDEEQTTRFLTSAQGTKHYALFHLAIVTGMRQAELLGLKWIDLSWTKGLLYVRRQMQRIPGQGKTFSEPKTRAGRRTIKLGETTLQILREHHARQQVAISLAGDRWIDQDLIFCSSIGTPLDHSNITKEFKAILRESGLPNIRFHDMRHTAASLMLNRGIPVIVVSKMLGHSKPSVTLDVYGHLYSNMQDEAVKVMEDLVTPIRFILPEMHTADIGEKSER